jgi:hypothetical protein
MLAKCSSAAEAASPASFQPEKAKIMIGDLSCGMPKISMT